MLHVLVISQNVVKKVKNLLEIRLLKHMIKMAIFCQMKMLLIRIRK